VYWASTFYRGLVFVYAICCNCVIWVIVELCGRCLYWY